MDYWSSLPWHKVGLLADFRDGIDKNQSGDPGLYGKDFEIMRELHAGDAEFLLAESHRPLAISTADIIFTAFSATIARLTQSAYVRFEMVTSGREPIFDGIDLSRTIGWVSNSVPRLIQMDPAASALEKIASYRAQLQATPHFGLGFHALKYMSDDPLVSRTLADIPPSEFNINYIPPSMAIQAVRRENLSFPWNLITEAEENPGPIVTTETVDQVWPMYIRVESKNGRILTSWLSRDNVYKQDTVIKAANLWISEINQLVEQLRYECTNLSLSPERPSLCEF